MPKSSAFALLIVCASGVIFAAGANEAAGSTESGLVESKEETPKGRLLADSCGRGKKYRQGGGSLLMIRKCCSPTRCAKMCKDHADCVAFDYFPYKGGCRLFSSLPQLRDSNRNSLYCPKGTNVMTAMIKAELKAPYHDSCTAATEALCVLPTLRI